MDFTRASELTAELHAEIDWVFEYQAWDAEKIARGALIRHALAHAVKVIVQNVPPCPDRSAAIRKIREAAWSANAAISHDGKY
jgi:hypothetical protein